MLFKNGISLSALYSALDDDRVEADVTTIKVGFTF